MAFLFVFFSDSCDSNVGTFNIVPEVSEVVLITCNSFFLSASFISTILFSTSLSYLLPQLFYCWFPSEWFWSQLLHYSLLINCSLFILGASQTFLASSQSLSLIYLSVTPFCFQDFGSPLLSLFWVLFQVDSLFPPLLFDFVGIYHVPLPVEYFSAFSFCSDCSVWCGLSLSWKFVVPFYCEGCSLWVGLD